MWWSLFVLAVYGTLCVSNTNVPAGKTIGIVSSTLTNFTSPVGSRKVASVMLNESDPNPCRSVVSFVNGIYHSYSDLQQIGCLLEEIFAEEVRVFYNPSTGNWFSDAYRAGVELFIKPNDLLIAKSLAHHLRKALKDVGTNGRVLHLAHSGGAIITYLAARYHLTSAETSRIDIATFGGGRSITRKYFRGGRIVNYYSQNDPLLLVDQRASLLSKLLNSSTTRETVSNTTYNITYNEIRDIKHNTTFIFLDGMMNNSILDHAMEGPTYVLALKLEAIAHKERMKEFSTFHEIQKHQFRLMRKKMARMTGQHHFWDESIPYSIRNVRKMTARLTNQHKFFSAAGQQNRSTSTNSSSNSPSNPSTFFSGFLESWGLKSKVPVRVSLTVAITKKTWLWAWQSFSLPAVIPSR